jgi:hypothetical protein
MNIVSEQTLITAFLAKGCDWNTARCKAMEAKLALLFSSKSIEETVEEYMNK